MLSYFKYNGGSKEEWDGTQWVTVTETPQESYNEGDTLYIENGLDITPVEGEMFLYWYLTIGSNGQTEPLPAVLDSNYIYQSDDTFTFPADYEDDDVFCFYACWDTPENIALEVYNKLTEPETIPVSAVYNTCLAIYLDLGYPYANYELVYGIINNMLPQSVAAETNGTISSDNVSNIWTGTQTEYDLIVNKNPKTLYMIVE